MTRKEKLITIAWLLVMLVCTIHAIRSAIHLDMSGVLIALITVRVVCFTGVEL